jgi:hypothetical protein
MTQFHSIIIIIKKIIIVDYDIKINAIYLKKFDIWMVINVPISFFNLGSAKINETNPSASQK